jgi:hypothetical protein
VDSGVTVGEIIMRLFVDELEAVHAELGGRRVAHRGGSRVVKNVFAAGCVFWKASIGVGNATPRFLPASAGKNCWNSSAVFVGKPLYEC